jgi:Ni,Fe-hydrogenase III large subunit
VSGAPTFRAAVASLPSEPKAFFDAARGRLEAGARAVTFYGQPADDPAELTLTLVLEAAGRLEVLRTAVARERGFHALTRTHPALHVFERDIFEQHGVKPHDHPWLKPVRAPGAGPAGMARYPFHVVEGREVHEVAVGPIHAGVIEPGHFRFMCLGEVVHHLEIELGWQHRGAAALLLKPDPRALGPLVETLAGDASVAHAWAWADALEALAGLAASPELELWRGVGLELERIAMHLAGLSGLANDVAFLQGAAGYGRLRTTVINATMLACGSRLGRGWVRPCALRVPPGRPLAGPLRDALALLERDVALLDDRLAASASVRARLDGVGVLGTAQALELGLVGPAARASGVALDARSGLPGELHRRLPVAPVVEPGGDCWARARVRMREVGASTAWIRAALDLLGEPAAFAAPVGPLAPSALAVAVRESWRGEVVHALETDATGRLHHYQAQDPSLRNWHGLAVAMRQNEISDFPICNKSFDLSYCGNDL